MANHPSDRKYHPQHTWAKSEGDMILVGISYHAQKELGEILFVELPEEGQEIKMGKPFGVVESAKVASDLIGPISGQVVAVNERLLEEAELVNEDPYGEGWMVKIKPADPGEMDNLLDSKEYESQ